MSGTKESKWVIPGAILIACIIGWFIYDANTRDDPGEFNNSASSSVDSSHE